MNSDDSQLKELKKFNMTINNLNDLIESGQREIFHIEGALNNLKMVLFIQSNNKESCLTVSPTTNKMVVDLFQRQQDLQIAIASYEREIKRIKQLDNDQIVMSAGYL